MNSSLATAWHIGVKIGGKELIFSGFVHIDQSTVDVEFDDMIIEFNFISEDAGQARYETEIEGDKKLIFKLYNHNNSLGQGLFTPVEIGNQDGRKLYITYYVNAIQSAQNKRRLEFALYLGEKI